MKKVLIADAIAEEGVRLLRAEPGVEVCLRTGLDEAALREAAADVDAIVVRSATRITRPVLEAARRLAIVGRAGIGVDNIDVAAATELGIVVVNTPDANAISAAELTLAHLLSLSRRLPAADRSVRAGEWRRSQLVGTEVNGKTLGIVGFGSIGRIVADRARGLGMQVVAHDPYVTAEVFEELGVEATTLDDLLARADFVTLHCPLMKKTRNLIDASRISRMKPGARIINCARGGLVDEAALCDALRAGHLAGAALDVFATEPPGDSPLFDLPNVEFTPHLGASTEEAQHAVGVEVARMIATYLTEGEVATAVNLPRLDGEQAARLRPYQDLARRLGRVLARMVESPPDRLDVTLLGVAAELEARPVALEALAAFLQESHSRPVNRVNALHVAATHGLALSETRSPQSQDYLSAVLLTACAGGGALTLAGTLFDERHPRLVRINRYEIEAPLTGHVLFTRHEDRPGVVGTLGTLLGAAGVNISRMHLGLAVDSAYAIAAIQVAEPLAEGLLREVAAIPAVDKVMQISL